MASGLFGISADHLEKYQSLDDRFIRDRAATFFFEVSGDAMSPLLMEKDVLIVDRSIEAMSGCVVVVQLEGELFCRRLKWDEDQVILTSDNPVHADIILKDGQELQIFGVVTSVMRDLLPKKNTHILGSRSKDGFR